MKIKTRFDRREKVFTITRAHNGLWRAQMTGTIDAVSVYADKDATTVVYEVERGGVVTEYYEEECFPTKLDATKEAVRRNALIVLEQERRQREYCEEQEAA